MSERTSIGVRVAGAAGQGMQTTADLLGRATTRANLFAFAHVDAQSRIRGGLNYSHLRISTQPRQAVDRRVDLLIAHSKPALDTYGPGVADGGLVLVQDDGWEHPSRAPFALAPLAEEAGHVAAAGIVGAAIVSALVGIDASILANLVRERFAGRNRLIAINLRAVELGVKAARGIDGPEGFRLPVRDRGGSRLWVMGAEAVALGAVAGGVDLIAAYPMSPATGVMTNLAQWTGEAGAVVEQAEDEIAAINMVAAASYAGARAMTATSGGGFALMTEGVSLIGMIETPAVIVLAQRPGPATGLPTRTAQGDLPLALYAGHGYFPRVILAPADVADCFALTAQAFDIAARFQVPVFVLTDQQLMDGQATVESFDLSGLSRERHLLGAEELAAMETYDRFRLTDDGISPRAAPGASRHTVVATSDEHGEDGHISDTAEVSQAMAEKRLRRAATVARQRFAPAELIGEPEGRTLVVSWGSSRAAVDEARERLGGRGLEFAHLHLRQLWPLDTGELAAAFDPADRVVVVENNVGGDLAELLQRVVGRPMPDRVNRIDGRPMSVEWLEEALESVLREGGAR